VKIAALGYYGFGNLGDEAVLAGIRAALSGEHAFDDATFLVLSNAPEETPRLHPGTIAANRWKWRETASALSKTDLFILGGGSLLQDATSVKSVLWYALMALLARQKSRRILWWGQGVGPLDSRASQLLVRLIGNQADAITVRDKKSAALLKAIGVRGSIETVADPAFALTPDLSSSSSAIAAAPVTIALRSWRDNAAIDRLFPDRNISDWFYEATGTREVLHLPMHLPDDAEFLQRFAPPPRMLHWREQGSVETALAQVATASMVIAMRLHALIFAARCAVPFVALSYDPKVDALAAACEQEDALLSVNDVSLTRERLRETIDRVRDTQQERRAKLRAFAEIQETAARRPARIAADLLGKN